MTSIDRYAAEELPENNPWLPGIRHSDVAWAAWWSPGRCSRRSSGRSSRIWMSGSGGCCCSGPRPGRWGMAGSGWWPGAAGVREATVSLGAAELEDAAEPLGRARRPGGGRKRAADLDPGLVPALRALVEPGERGDPVSPLWWTTKSTRNLADELTRQGHKVSADTVGGPAAGRGVQPAGQRQDHRGDAAPGPGRPVPLHQRAGPGPPGQR